MFTFDDYRAPSCARVVELIEHHPFAAVVSTTDTGPRASHLPVLPALDDEAGWQDQRRSARALDESSFGGRRLWSHLARENPQWHDFASGAPVLVIFTGPHAYVSARHYERTPAVPTWNYSAAHITGTPRILTDDMMTLELLKSTVTSAETATGSDWDMEPSVSHFARLQRGIVAFEITIDRVQSVFKLSQDKPDVLYDRVLDGLSAEGGAGRAVSDDMRHIRRPSDDEQ